MRLLVALGILSLLAGATACSRPPDMAALETKLKASGFVVEKNPNALPPGTGDVLALGKAAGMDTEFFKVDGFSLHVMRFNNDDIAKKVEAKDLEKEAQAAKSIVPQWKPMQAKGRAKNFVVIVGSLAGEPRQQGELDAKLAAIRKAIDEM